MSIEYLVIEIQNGNTELKSELWERIKRLVYKFINVYTDYAIHHYSEPDELANIAWLGVERAINDYKPEKGFKFNSYLRYHINNVIAEFFGFRGAKRVNTISLDTPLNDETDLTICDTIEDERAATAFDNVERSLMGDFVNSMVDKLKPLHKYVIRGLFYENKTQRELAECLGVNPSYIGSIKSTALNTLRRSREITEYYNEFSYKHVGYKTFNTTWTSSTERAVLNIERFGL